jgi:hypothetical protein
MAAVRYSGRGCGRHRVIDVERYGDDVPVPWFGPRMRELEWSSAWLKRGKYPGSPILGSYNLSESYYASHPLAGGRYVEVL